MVPAREKYTLLGRRESNMLRGGFGARFAAPASIVAINAIVNQNSSSRYIWQITYRMLYAASSDVS